jgi:hypothetical protein
MWPKLTNHVTGINGFMWPELTNLPSSTPVWSINVENSGSFTRYLIKSTLRSQYPNNYKKAEIVLLAGFSRNLWQGLSGIRRSSYLQQLSSASNRYHSMVSAASIDKWKADKVPPTYLDFRRKPGTWSKTMGASRTVVDPTSSMIVCFMYKQFNRQSLNT